MIALHPQWEHRFYDDGDCRGLVRRELPCLLPLYDAYPTTIQRVDLFRIVAVYVGGGFYIDLDVECREAARPAVRSRLCRR